MTRKDQNNKRISNLTAYNELIIFVGVLLIGLFVVFLSAKVSLNPTINDTLNEGCFLKFIRRSSSITSLMLFVLALVINSRVIYNFNSTVIIKTIKDLHSSVKAEVKTASFSNYKIFFFFACITVFLMLSLKGHIVTSILFLCLGFMPLLKSLQSIKYFSERLRENDFEIKEEYKKNYKWFYYFNNSIIVLFILNLVYLFFGVYYLSHRLLEILS